MFLIDTNVISELRKARSGKTDPNVLAWAEAVDANQLFLSAISVMELEMGVLQIERRDQAQGELLRDWFENQVLPEFEDRIIPVDTAVARDCARLHIPNPRSERDALIAASAIVHRMRLVTRNTTDFEVEDLEVLNPWLVEKITDR
ncbi:MAG: type II toxin-antitoxin system VapC family toxin [Pseudomonadota bacterium]